VRAGQRWGWAPIAIAGIVIAYFVVITVANILVGGT
jgi:hypothetical protein